MTVALLNIDWQTLADATGLGGIYALMAVGIGLVFGVLRLVNFAYGQLIMAGAYALAFASERGWPVSIGIVLCFAVVLTLSLLMDRLVFRPLRGQTPAVMLVTTFAVAFLLQSIALLWFGPLGKIASSLATLNQPVTISGVDIRKIAIVATAVAAFCLLVLVLLLERTRVGLHMRAAAMDFSTAELLGVRAGRVISAAVLVSGVLAGAKSPDIDVDTNPGRVAATVGKLGTSTDGSALVTARARNLPDFTSGIAVLGLPKFRCTSPESRAASWLELLE